MLVSCFEKPIEEVPLFAGIVEDTADVLSVSDQPEGRELTLRSALLAKTALGDSVACAGVCLTVAGLSGETATFHVASETLRKTTLGNLRLGDLINIERSLRLDDRIDGHFVFGHVDSIADTLAVEVEGETRKFVFSLPEAITNLVAPKGSISVSGVSLTVGEVGDETFSVYVVPHTLQNTTFSQLQPGMQVNIEADMLARYVARVLSISDKGVNRGA